MTERPNRPGIDEFARETVSEHAEKVAFTETTPDPAIRPAGKNVDELTFGELDDAANRVANKLRGLGYGTGDALSVQVPNWCEFPILHLGAVRAGLTTLPILPEHRASEVGFMMDLCESDLLVIPSEFRGFDYVEMVESLVSDGAIDPAHVVVIGDFEADDDRFHSWGWLTDASADTVVSPMGPDDLAQILFTSGTTGEPKGVRQTQFIGMSHVLPPNDEVYGVESDDVIFAATPVAHNAGYHYCMRLGIVTGARCVLFDKWSPSAAVETLADEACSFSIGATTFLADVVRANEDEDAGYDLPALETFVLSGSSIPRAVVEDAYDAFSNLTAVAAWGQTENGVVTATRRDDPIERVVTTDGKAISHCEVEVRDGYDGERLVGEVGNLVMRGDSLLDGYHRRPEITDDSFTADVPGSDATGSTGDASPGRWFETGDLAVMDSDGYISIEGREKDIIIRGGENISAAEIEEYLVEHPAIREVALVAMPDDRLQERPCAYVQLAEGADADDVTVAALHEFLEDRGVQAHKHPERVEIVEEFPRTSTGKVQKFHLREDVAEKLDRDPV